MQITKDHHYIINHDKDFNRLAGIDKKIQELTLEEIKNLEIQDSNGKSNIATIEEALEMARGKIVLFIELKGENADDVMADDIVSLVKGKNMSEDCVIIAFQSHLIEYIETKYPDIKTGYLCDTVTDIKNNLGCEYILLDEKIATKDRIYLLHLGGKKVLVWTVDEEQSIKYFLNSNVDGIITNEIEKAQNIQKNLKNKEFC